MHRTPAFAMRLLSQQVHREYAEQLLIRTSEPRVLVELWLALWRHRNLFRLMLMSSQFGGCLALRVALAAPELVERMVLVNPATCFSRSLGGLSSLIAATNLLSLFPSPLYQVRLCLHRTCAFAALKLLLA